MTRPQAPDQSGVGHYKDEILDDLARTANVAQFVSFSPGEPQVRFVHIFEPGDVTTVETAIATLFARSGERAINVRSFDPAQPKSHEFIYGLTDPRIAVSEVRRLAASGLFTIVNETIDVSDGGVSGVALGGIVEFAPDDTPRCVDKPGTASLPQPTALEILETVYGFRPELDFAVDQRVEFSVHPLRRGVRHRHTVIWEIERFEALDLEAAFTWPNRFSRLLGDKVFGLLIASAAGLRVPRSRVVTRRVAPFEFGESTGTGETWTRTAPTEQVPGCFTTTKGWIDPFDLLKREDPTDDAIPSVIAQEGVEARFAGAAVFTTNGDLLVEGVHGSGEGFMLGNTGPEALPPSVIDDVKRVLADAAAKLGAIRAEWVNDGNETWIVQLHRGVSESSGMTIYPGATRTEVRFPVERGLDGLRELIEEHSGTDHGIVLVGRVGITSHFGDVLRRAKIPSRIEPTVEPFPERLFDAI